MSDGTGTRCFGEGDPLLARYHDKEWGFPVLDERGLFERMSLEAFQSGCRATISSPSARRSAARPSAGFRSQQNQESVMFTSSCGFNIAHFFVKLLEINF